MKTIEQIALGTQFSESQVESLMEVKVFMFRITQTRL